MEKIIKNCRGVKKQLANELHKPIIRKFKKKRKVYSSFKENILSAD